jgi:protein-S-isoprenylcysteine O-methyltransferase Ste14
LPNDGGNGRRPPYARVGEGLLKVVSLFVILEPLWMLLPFAGFLYGSVLHIRTLSRSPHTAWLTHFVFPILTLGLVGPILGAVGLLLFLAAAAQVYLAKVRRSGLVERGLYRFVRHPQYTALTLFGIGILLTWGRALAFVAFFLMMFLYYLLARLEERSCLRRFGEEYERYRERTSFAFPGDRLLRPLLARLPGRHLPGPVRVLAGFAVTAALCFGLMLAIDSAKRAWRTVPFLAARIEFPEARTSAPGLDRMLEAGRAGGLRYVRSDRLVMVRGPYRNAAAPGFAERVLLSLRESPELSSALDYAISEGEDLAVAFGIPFERRAPEGAPGRIGPPPEGRGPPPDPHGPDRVTLIVFRVRPEPGARLEEIFADPGSRTLLGACLAPADLAREDISAAPVFRPGPGFPAESRWAELVRLAGERAPANGTGPEIAVAPGSRSEATLVLVKAPILRTRLDPAFAEEILERLAASKRLRDRLRDAGAGGEVIAVAFPTPGRDWYREHHGKPELEVFVALVRLSPDDLSPEDLFRDERRRLLGAFFATLDFKRERCEDAVGDITPLGPLRDLEERWDFFLSGV